MKAMSILLSAAAVLGAVALRPADAQNSQAPRPQASPSPVTAPLNAKSSTMNSTNSTVNKVNDRINKDLINASKNTPDTLKQSTSKDNLGKQVTADNKEKEKKQAEAKKEAQQKKYKKAYCESQCKNASPLMTASDMQGGPKPVTASSLAGQGNAAKQVKEQCVAICMGQ